MKLLHKTLVALSCAAMTVAPMVTTASAKGFGDLGRGNVVVIGPGGNVSSNFIPGGQGQQCQPGAGNLPGFIQDFINNTQNRNCVTNSNGTCVIHNGGNCGFTNGNCNLGGNCILPPNFNCPDDDLFPDTPIVPDIPIIPDNPIVPDEPITPDNPDVNLGDFAKEVVRLVNQERAAAGLSALEVSTSVQNAAQVRAKEQATSFSHTRPDGSNFTTALTQAGVSYRRAGENIAWGQKSPAQVMNGWMNSSGHRANILNPDFGHIGVGFYQDSNGTTYWTQLFTN